MQGYLGNPDASRDAFDPEGWLRTGDVGYECQGKLYIVDRKKVCAFRLEMTLQIPKGVPPIM